MNQFQRATKTPEELALYDAEVKARAIEYQRNWRKKNSVRYYALQKKRREANPEREKAHRMKYAAKNREILLRKSKEYALKNPEKRKASFYKYLDKNRASLYEAWSYKEALKRGCVVADRDVIVGVYAKAIELSKSSGQKWSVDHIIPLALGGHHRPENVQVMLHSVNQIKSGNPFWISEDKSFLDWRDVSVEFWPRRFTQIYNEVVKHSCAHKQQIHAVA